MKLMIAITSICLLSGCAVASGSPPPSLPTSEDLPVPATPTAVPRPTQIAASASWIEVDLGKQTVLLHQGDLVVAEYLASSGVTDDPQYATPSGLYHVQSKEKGPIENVPGVFVTDIILFDIQKGNGIHSRPMDASGNLLDPTLGQPSTAGCVRVEESARVYEFAKLGMWVWIH